MQQLQQQFDPKQQAQFVQEFKQLQQRQMRLRFSLLLSLGFLAMSLLLLFYHQQLCYAIFQFSPQLQHLHIPTAAASLAAELGASPDYFMQFIIWLGWLGIKLCGSLMLASVLLFYLKKLGFVARRVRGFMRNSLFWLLLFILSWWGLASVQQRVLVEDRNQARYQQAMSYASHIQQSELYQQLEKLNLPEAINAYLLAQTALLHRPSDVATASGYLQQLIAFEQQQPQQFQSYGFQPEQLFAMQRQIHAKALSPSAQSVAYKLQMVNQWSQYSYWFFSVLAALFFASLLVCYALNWRFNTRIQRITAKINR